MSDRTIELENPRMSDIYTRVKPSKGWLSINLRELWAYRDLLLILSLREIQLRYKQTALGVTWVVLQPLLTSAIFSLIFGRLADLPSGDVPYELFAYAGLLPWTMFSQSLQRAAGSLVKDTDLVTKVYFPRVIIPLSSTTSTLVDFVIALAVFGILMAIYRIPPVANMLALPLLLTICLFTAVGVGLWVSAFSVYYRDFIYALPFVIQAWMFASPLAYSESLIPEKWRGLYALNPMVGVIEGFRWSLFGGGKFPWLSMSLSLIVGGAIFMGGAFVFRRIERRFADVI